LKIAKRFLTFGIGDLKLGDLAKL